MRTSTQRALGVAMTVAAVAACTDTSSPDHLSIADKSALVTAVTNSNSFSGMGAAAPFAPIGILLVNNAGPLTATAAGAGTAFDLAGAAAATYEGAIGIQVIFDVTSGGSHSTGSFTGVVGWAGLNTSANTVDELVSAGSLTSPSMTPIGDGVTTPIGSSATGPARTGFSAYSNHTTGSNYTGTTGSFVLTSASFSGSAVDCSQTYAGHTVTCSYVRGTMSGSFDFGASESNSGSGPATYTQPTVHFSTLPSVKLTITVAS